MKKIKKRQYGYINYEKKRRLGMLLLYIFIGILIYVVGYIINKGNRANLFTVIAFLSVLPTAKRVVELVVLLPYKTPSLSQYNKIKGIIGSNAILICDFVFTSTDKSMGLDFLVVEEGTAIGVVSSKKQDITYIRDYLKKSFNNYAPDFELKLVYDLEGFEKEYKTMEKVIVTEKQMEEVWKQLRVLSV